MFFEKRRPTIEICSVWEDESIFEIVVRARNATFCGESRCYTTRDEIQKLSDAIAGFPKSVADNVHFSTYSSDKLSYFSLHLLCIDGSGHTLVRVKVADIVSYSNARSVNNIAEFDLPIEPAAIDVFSNALSKLSKGGVGDVTAILDGIV